MTGVGLGFSLVMAPLYIAELAPPGDRGALVAFTDLLLNVGIVAGFLAGFLLSDLPPGVNWRWMLGLGLVPAAGLALGAGPWALFLPESPRWLVMHQRIAGAESVLLKTSQFPEQVPARLAEIREAVGIATPNNPPLNNAAEENGVPRYRPRDKVKGYTVVASREGSRGVRDSRGVSVWKELWRATPAVKKMNILYVGVSFFGTVSAPRVQNS